MDSLHIDSQQLTPQHWISNLAIYIISRVRLLPFFGRRRRRCVVLWLQKSRHHKLLTNKENEICCVVDHLRDYGRVCHSETKQKKEENTRVKTVDICQQHAQPPTTENLLISRIESGIRVSHNRTIRTRYGPQHQALAKHALHFFLLSSRIVRRVNVNLELNVCRTCKICFACGPHWHIDALHASTIQPARCAGRNYKMK